MVFCGCNVRWGFTGSVCFLRNANGDVHERFDHFHRIPKWYCVVYARLKRSGIIFAARL